MSSAAMNSRARSIDRAARPSGPARVHPGLWRHHGAVVWRFRSSIGRTGHAAEGKASLLRWQSARSGPRRTGAAQVDAGPSKSGTDGEKSIAGRQHALTKKPDALTLRSDPAREEAAKLRGRETRARQQAFRVPGLTGKNIRGTSCQTRAIPKRQRHTRRLPSRTEPPQSITVRATIPPPTSIRPKLIRTLIQRINRRQKPTGKALSTLRSS